MLKRSFILLSLIGGLFVFINCSTPLLTAQGVVNPSGTGVGVNQNYLYAMGGLRELQDDKEQTVYQVWVLFFNDATNLNTLNPETFIPGTDYPSGEYLLMTIASADLNSIVSDKGYSFSVYNPEQQKNVVNYFEISMDLGSDGTQAKATYQSIGKVGTIDAAIHINGTKLTYFDGSFSMDFEYPDFIEGDFSVNFEE